MIGVGQVVVRVRLHLQVHDLDHLQLRHVRARDLQAHLRAAEGLDASFGLEVAVIASDGLEPDGEPVALFEVDSKTVRPFQLVALSVI